MPQEQGPCGAMALQAALSDGQHYVCPLCGGIVAVARAEQHARFWCQTPTTNSAAAPEGVDTTQLGASSPSLPPTPNNFSARFVFDHAGDGMEIG
jgi:hypothetical protein